MAENLTTHQIFDCDVTECDDGHQYVKVKSVVTNVKFEDFSFKFESETVVPFIAEMINRFVNANWKLFYKETEPQFKNILGEIIQTILTPIFKKIVIRDFFQ